MDAIAVIVGFVIIVLVISVLIAVIAGSADRTYYDRDQSLDNLQAKYHTAKVLSVIDGDTVIVAVQGHQLTLRLDAIDCPEIGQHWGDLAKYGLIKMIGGQSIRFWSHGQDQYGRTLATIYVRYKADAEWTCVNSKMVIKGHAWVSRPLFDHLPEEQQQELFKMQRWARSKRVGLWRESDPVPPWKWRNASKSPKSNVISTKRR